MRKNYHGSIALWAFSLTQYMFLFLLIRFATSVSMLTTVITTGISTDLATVIMVVIFVLPSQQQAILAPLFSIVYRTGAWVIGAGLLFTCLWGKGKPGLIPGIIMLVFYMITTFVTLFGLMGLTVNRELQWYIHPVLIISGCIFALWNRKKK